jgi:hypothetical protein
MKSGGQIDGQMSSQSPVVWWYREVNCEIVGICVAAVPSSTIRIIMEEYEMRM